jgi:uncharacterized membrane protein YkoI
MRLTTRMIGITLGSVVLATGPALAAPPPHSATIGWSTAGAVAAERVAGDILATRLESGTMRKVYDVDIQTADRRLEEVQVDARNARVLGVHEVTDPGIIGEVEAP